MKWQYLAATLYVAYVLDGHMTRYCHFIGSSYSLHVDKRMVRYLPDPFSLVRETNRTV